MKWFYLVIVLLVTVGLAACGGEQATVTPATPTSTASIPATVIPATVMTATQAVVAPTTVTATNTLAAPNTLTETAVMTDVMTEAEVAATARPAWQQLPLVDARTGATFTLADFAGKTVFVETMATWCTNCRQQLEIVKSLQATLPDENVVFVALSVETTLEAATLAQYADDAGFAWTFAVITPELLQELATRFGRTITNPPSTPHFVIYPDGSTTELITGIESAEQLRSHLQNSGG